MGEWGREAGREVGRDLPGLPGRDICAGISLASESLFDERKSADHIDELVVIVRRRPTAGEGLVERIERLRAENVLQETHGGSVGSGKAKVVVVAE